MRRTRHVPRPRRGTAHRRSRLRSWDAAPCSRDTPRRPSARSSWSGSERGARPASRGRSRGLADRPRSATSCRSTRPRARASPPRAVPIHTARDRAPSRGCRAAARRYRPTGCSERSHRGRAAASRSRWWWCARPSSRCRSAANAEGCSRCDRAPRRVARRRGTSRRCARTSADPPRLASAPSAGARTRTRRAHARAPGLARSRLAA